MRAGAIPLFAWALLLAVLLALNWIWTGDWIQVASFGFAVLAVAAGGVLLVVRGRREALRRGPPPTDARAVPVPSASAGAVLAALGTASVLFGLTFGHFAIYFGAGVLAASLGRLAVEHRAQRQDLRRLSKRGRR